jgi:hypothetical protein
MFENGVNLYQHVNFKTSYKLESSSLIDLVMTTRPETIKQVTNAGHIQQNK